MSALFCFGLGYSAMAAAKRLLSEGSKVAGTVRTPEKAERIAGEGILTHVFDGTARSGDIAEALSNYRDVLVSIAPDQDGDPVLRHYADDLVAAKPRLVIYLSTVGVYGNHDGNWVDEETPIDPQSDRSKRRAEAESAWLSFGAQHGIDILIYRLSGIYGPGRSPIDRLRSGTAKRIVKPGQMFNRIHVEDIAGAIVAGLRRPHTGVYNITDTEPAPPQDVVAFAAHLTGLTAPREVPFDEAEMSDMARSFYSENKRVAGAKAQRMLGWRLTYPTYREGLEALAKEA